MRTKPLESLKQRQADTTFAGWNYQLWHSLYAWLVLCDHEVLYLERAEDFDVISPERSVAVQVKHSRKKLSLRSASAKDALSNYLELRRLNPGRNFHLRFLTTSATAIEQGRPFGTGIAGMDLWNRVTRYNDAGVPLIRDFLLAQTDLPKTLRAFLEEATLSSILTDLVLPVKWETASRGSECVEDSVEDILINHGDRYLVRPHECVRVVGSLLKHILQTAASPNDRSLTRSHFLKLFEELTSARVSHGELLAIRRSASASPLLSAIHPAEVDFIDDLSPIRDKTPPLDPDLARREPLLASLRQELDHVMTLVLHGSSGVGKTTVANNLAADAENLVWLDCRECSPREVSRLLRQLPSVLRHLPGDALVVIDDLDLAPSSSKHLESSLGTLAYSLRNAPGQRTTLLVTSHRHVPGTLLRILGIESTLQKRIPEFEQSDIYELAINMGCPEAQAEKMKGVIFLHTEGHPQLVHARLSALRQNGWPALGLNEIWKEPEDVKQERREARSLLLQTLPEDGVALLYHLSVLIGYFRRDHAIKLAESEALQLKNPGDLFEIVVGPWVESVGSGYYRVSALLRNAASDSWSPERLIRVHCELAALLLDVGDLTLREVSSVLSHSLAGSTERPLVRVCMSLLAAPSSARRAIARALSWVAAVSTAPDAVPGDPLTRCLFRAIQFRIAEESRPEYLESIISAWKTTIAEIEDDALRQMQRFFMAGEIISSMTAPLSARLRVSALLELEEIADQRHEFREMLETFSADLENIASGSEDALASLFPMIAFQCRGPAAIMELIDLLEELDAGIRQRLLHAYREGHSERALFVDNAWIDEVKKAAPDWSSSIGTLERVVAFSKSQAVTSMEASAYAALAAIHAEHKGEPAKAHEYLDTAGASLADHPIIRNQRAAVYFEEERYSDALDIWRDLLETWSSETTDRTPDTRRTDMVFGARNAGISAARIGEWSEAGEFFLQGARSSAGMKGFAQEPGFFADAGFCYWKEGNAADCVRCFEMSLTKLEELPPPKASITSRVLGKLVGHVLLWLETVIRGGDTSPLGEPEPGLCSGTEQPTVLRDLIITPIEMSWLHLSKIEAALLPNMAVFERQRERLLSSSLAVVRMFSRDLEVRYLFRSECWEELPSAAGHLEREYAIAEQNRIEGREISEPDLVGRDQAIGDPSRFAPDLYVAAILVNLVAREGTLRALLERWRSATEKDDTQELMAPFFEQIFNALALSAKEALRMLLAASESRDRRLLAGLRLALEDRLRPEESFYVQTKLFDSFAGGLWSELVESALATLVTRDWLAHASVPGTLRAPRITVPDIASACGAEAEGMAKVAGILMAALPAVNVKLSAAVWDKLRGARERPR